MLGATPVVRPASPGRFGAGRAAVLPSGSAQHVRRGARGARPGHFQAPAACPSVSAAAAAAAGSGPGPAAEAGADATHQHGCASSTHARFFPGRRYSPVPVRR